ncbi:type II toxin-antitoxin system HicB family antitoxin [Streptantibioticus ferralitis]|uniref:XRE family transcriptional regulator n=1 Tax=Streptantibioticus ferralitis TaxID=236510 RepID=A0ABT5YU98_9ACTN|nr:hypothetical protein [Streptantibioticus ferralitis]MDF2255187.1 hypothetical protein [Streptantibioticus ferralitis]
MSTRYEVRLHRIGRWWAVDIPALTIYTQCRTLDEAEGMARDAIAEALRMPPETVAVDLVVPQIAALMQSVREARRRRAAAASAEEQAVADAVRALLEDLGMSQGDACRLLGISHQEASQLSPARGSGEFRAWPVDPLPAPSAPVRSIRGGAGTTRPLTGRQRPGPANGSPDGNALVSPKRHRAPVTRPSWAIAEDDA